MKSAINFPLFLLVMLLTAALAGAGFLLTHIDTDITRYRFPKGQTESLALLH
ncbi:MAG: hypothetical protein R2941_21615 [Desulfobacterales bacterium]